MLSNKQRTNIVWFDLHEILKVGKFIGTERRMLVARGWLEGELMFNDYRISTWRYENSAGLDGGDGCT